MLARASSPHGQQCPPISKISRREIILGIAFGNAIPSMKHENLLKLTARAGYISAATLALADAKDTTPEGLRKAHERAKKLLMKGVRLGHLKGYTKAQGVRIFGLTQSGANHLIGLGHKAKATYKQAYDAKHVYHRLCADAFSIALSHAHMKASSDAGLKASSWFERDCLRRSATFKMHFNKVPDSAFFIEKSLCWIEVDTARKKASDMLRLIKFIKHGMCLDESHLAVIDIGSPEVLLWVCAPAAVRDAASKIQQYLPIKNEFKKLSEGVWKVTIDSGSIERDVVLCSFDFSSVADLHTRIFKFYSAALNSCCPVQF